MVGCVGVVNECLAQAEVLTMTSPVHKERLSTCQRLIVATFPLIGEIALTLSAFPPLHARLFVFLVKPDYLDLLPLFTRHLERALTVSYFELSSVS